MPNRIGLTTQDELHTAIVALTTPTTKVRQDQRTQLLTISDRPVRLNKGIESSEEERKKRN